MNYLIKSADMTMDYVGQCSYVVYVGKSSLKQHTVYLDPGKHDLFMLLAQQTRIAQAVFVARGGR